jgi:Tfp pilus assembly PilM family ATPase
MSTLSRRKSFLDLFPVPEFLLLSTTSIVITDDDTKFVQLRRKIFGDGFELTHATKVPNTKGAVESGLIISPQELVPSLKKLATHYGIYYAHAILPEERAYLFTTTIGSVPPEGLRDAVAFILEENAPIALSESVFDFEIINEDKNASEIKLAVSVVPKNIVNAYVSLFESIGITPISFELESQAIARAVIHREDKRPQLIINLSLKKTGFYVVEDSVVQFSTTPAYGFGAEGAYSNFIDLKSEMRKVLTFWNVRTDKFGKPTKKIEKVVLCGSGANDEDFVKKLMEEVDIEYLLADVWLNTSSSREHMPEIPFSESLDYASAIGLVLSNDK